MGKTPESDSIKTAAEAAEQEASTVESTQDDSDTTTSTEDESAHVDENSTSADSDTEGTAVQIEEGKTYTQDEFEELVRSAVGAGVEAKIKSRVDRITAQKKTAEEDLAAVRKQLDDLRGSVESDTKALKEQLSKVQKDSVKYKVAYESKIDVASLDSVIDLMKGDSEEELRAIVAASRKLAGKPTDGYDLFSGKNYTDTNTDSTAAALAAAYGN